MEAKIRDQYSQVVLDAAVERFGLNPDHVHALDAFESYVYRAQHEGRPSILRISHSLHRDATAIAGELEWINYLADNGVDACRAFSSQHGNFVEQLGDDSPFSAALFEMAPGGPAIPDLWQPPLFESMGRMMGRMHALAKTYEPSSSAIRRPSWDSDMAGSAEKFIPDQPRIIEKINAINAATHALPHDKDSFGLVHIDFHRGNFFVDGGRIYLFDFDDCHYSWFADDIAVCLFYAIPHDCTSAADKAAACRFLRHFMAGYRQENTLDVSWLTQIPLFQKRRELDLYTVIHRSYKGAEPDPWSASFLTNRVEKILNDVPYLDIEFEQF